MERKYDVKLGEVYKYWKVLKTEIMQLQGKNKDRKTYNNALCICTKCNKNTQIISYKRLHDKNGTFMCQECDGQKKKSTKEYINDLKIKNPLVKLKDGEIYINSKTKLEHICSVCGEDFSIAPNTALKGQHMCNECGHKIGFNEMRWDTNKYIEELKIRNPFVKLKENEEYINNQTKIAHICGCCGNDWNVKPAKVLNGQTMCKKCSARFSESVHASLIKQVYKHHYEDDCIWEEKIQIDDNVYEVDIVNHNKKEAIEIDGGQHDKISDFHVRAAKKHNTTPEYEFEQQMIRDNKVNDYFVEMGYNLIRVKVGHNKTPLQALQEIFPQYDSIPTWIDFSCKITRHIWDINKAQKMINDNINLSEIAKQLKIDPSSLTQAINYGQLILPKYYRKLKTIYWNIEEAQRLLDEGKKVKEIASEINVPPSTIRGALDRKALIRH